MEIPYLNGSQNSKIFYTKTRFLLPGFLLLNRKVASFASIHFVSPMAGFLGKHQNVRLSSDIQGLQACIS